MGKTVLVSAHGNSIRVLMTQILNMPATDISKVEVQTGALNIYDFDSTMTLKEHYKLEIENEVIF